MKITIDHNCLLDIESNTDQGRAILQLAKSPDHECFIVNIGASELRQRGIRPDSYDLFDGFIRALGLTDLKRLNPLMLIDIGFIGYGVLASEEMVKLSEKIEAILFPQPIENDTFIETPPYAPIGRKQLNRICDVHTMWCHIYYCNEVFLTSDKNFHKNSKKSQLTKLGAGLVMTPSQMTAWRTERHGGMKGSKDEIAITI